jgi:anti-sigma B factor antagonist
MLMRPRVHLTGGDGRVEASISTRRDGVVPVVDVSGEIDLYTSPKLKAALDELLATGQVHFLVNLLDTTYLDSTALSILTSALKHVQGAGGMLGLVFNQPQIDRIFTITGLKDVFPTFVSQAEALAGARAWVKVASKE